MEPEIDPRRVTEQLRIGLVELLESRGLTRTDLAELMGVTQPYVSRMLNGGRPLTLVFVAHALAVLCGDLEVKPASAYDYEWTRVPDLGRSA